MEPRVNYSIYCFNGPSCTGKSTLQKLVLSSYLSDFNTDMQKIFIDLPNLKYTTRVPRDGEVLNVGIFDKIKISLPIFEIRKQYLEFYLTYSYGGGSYGLSKNSLIDQLNFAREFGGTFPIVLDTSNPNIRSDIVRRTENEIKDYSKDLNLDSVGDSKNILVISSINTLRSKVAHRLSNSDFFSGKEIAHRIDNDVNEMFYFLTKLPKYDSFTSPFAIAERSVEQRSYQSENFLSEIDYLGYSKFVELYHKSFDGGDFENMTRMEVLNLLSTKTNPHFNTLGLIEVLEDFRSLDGLKKKIRFKTYDIQRRINNEKLRQLKIYSMRLQKTFSEKVKSEVSGLPAKLHFNCRVKSKRDRISQKKARSKVYSSLDKLIEGYFDPSQLTEDKRDPSIISLESKLQNLALSDYLGLSNEELFYGVRNIQTYYALLEKREVAEAALDLFKGQGSTNTAAYQHFSSLLQNANDHISQVQLNLGKIYKTTLSDDLLFRITKFKNEFEKVERKSKKNRNTIKWADISNCYSLFRGLYQKSFVDSRLRTDSSFEKLINLFDDRRKKDSNANYNFFIKFLKRLQEDNKTELPSLYKVRANIYADVLLALKKLNLNKNAVDEFLVGVGVRWEKFYELALTNYSKKVIEKQNQFFRSELFKLL